MDTLSLGTFDDVTLWATAEFAGKRCTTYYYGAERAATIVRYQQYNGYLVKFDEPVMIGLGIAARRPVVSSWVADVTLI